MLRRITKWWTEPTVLSIVTPKTKLPIRWEDTEAVRNRLRAFAYDKKAPPVSFLDTDAFHPMVRSFTNHIVASPDAHFKSYEEQNKFLTVN